VAISSGDVGEVSGYDQNAALIWSVRWNDPIGPYTPAHANALLDFVLAQQPGDLPPAVREQLSGRMRGFLDEMELPLTLPPIGAILITASGDLWLAHPESPGIATATQPEVHTDWWIVRTSARSYEDAVHKVALPAGVSAIGPSNEGDLLALLVDDFGRQGLATIRPLYK